MFIVNGKLKNVSRETYNLIGEDTMLKEDIYRDIKINEEEYKKLENDILELQDQVERTERLRKSLQEETEKNIDIFSPRSIKSESKEKLKHVLEKLEILKKELDRKNTDILLCKQRKVTLDEMLKKFDDNSLQPCEEKTDIQQNESMNPESDIYGDVQNERFLAGNRISDRIKNQVETADTGYTELEEDDTNEINNEKKINMEIQSGEVIILERERRKEREFLEQLFLKLEHSLALLNGNKNLCKKEMQQAKKMISDYVKTISN